MAHQFPGLEGRKLQSAHAIFPSEAIPGEAVTLDILMPFYGRFDHLQSAVSSIRAQSDPDWRLVVIDDLYPDAEPGRWVTELGDDRIFYLRNEVNLGVSGNFRKAAELATAEYAVIIGCDDVMQEGYVARAKQLTGEFPGAAIVQMGVGVIDDEGRPSLPLADRVKALYRPRGGHHPALYSGEALARSLLRGNWTYFPSLCWNVQALKEHPFRQDYDVVLDLALQLEIIMDGGAMLIDDEPTFLYRRHSSSVSSWKAVDGSRFVQEADLFHESARSLDTLGWHCAARTARYHLSSRLNAASQLPKVLGPRDSGNRRLLLAHLFGRAAR